MRFNFARDITSKKGNRDSCGEGSKGIDLGSGVIRGYSDCSRMNKEAGVDSDESRTKHCELLGRYAAVFFRPTKI